MTETVAEIYETLERALARRDSVAVLRTCVQWWSAFDDSTALLRAAFEALVARGRDERASELGREWLRRGVATGDLLASAEAALRVGALREDVENGWQTIAHRLRDDRPRGAIRPISLGLASPHAPAAHDLDELVDRLIAQSQRSAPDDAPPPNSVPLVDDLAGDATELLREAVPRSVPTGAPLLGPEDAVGWLMSGAMSTESGERPGVPGTLLIGARAPEQRRARCPSHLLAIPESAFAPWRDDERVTRFLARSLRRAYTVEALGRCGWFEALSPRGRERMLAAVRPIVCGAGTLIDAGSVPDGLFVLVRGRADIADRDGRVLVKIASVGPGDVLGESPILTRKPAKHEVVLDAPAAFLLIPAREAAALCDEEPDAYDWLAALAAQRREDVERLDTGEVILLDE